MTALQRAATDALQCQNACNLSGVVHSWAEHLDALWAKAHDLGRGTDWVNTHPVNVLFASKVSALTGGDSGHRYFDAEDACRRIAKGELDEHVLVGIGSEVAHA